MKLFIISIMIFFPYTHFISYKNDNLIDEEKSNQLYNIINMIPGAKKELRITHSLPEEIGCIDLNNDEKINLDNNKKEFINLNNKKNKKNKKKSK
jgi:hypothetical protein